MRIIGDNSTNENNDDLFFYQSLPTNRDESIKHPSGKRVQAKFGTERISPALLRHPRFIFREAT